MKKKKKESINETIEDKGFTWDEKYNRYLFGGVKRCTDKGTNEKIKK